MRDYTKLFTGTGSIQQMECLPGPGTHDVHVHFKGVEIAAIYGDGLQLGDEHCIEFQTLDRKSTRLNSSH